MLRLSRTLKQSSLAYYYLLLLCIVANQIGAQIHGSIHDNEMPYNIVRNTKSKEVLKYMNLSADPCKDFYEYACGNWEKHNGKNLLEGEQFSVQSMLQQSIDNEIKVILEEPSKDATHVIKIKDFYNACRNVDSPSQRQKTFMINFIKQHGGLNMVPNTGWQRNYDWIQTIAQLRANYDFDILIGLGIDSNIELRRGSGIFFDEPKKTIIPIEYCRSNAAESGNIRDKVYEDIQRRVAMNMQTWLEMREPDANRFAGDVVRFEFELCKGMRQGYSSITNNENEISNRTFGRGIDITVPNHQRTAQNKFHGLRDNIYPYLRMDLYQLIQHFDNTINFRIFLDIILNTGWNNQIYMRSEHYFQQLMRSIKSNNKHTIANYIMYRALDELNFSWTEQANPVSRSNQCIALLQRYFPKEIGDLYMRKNYHDYLRKDLEYIFNSIIKALELRLQVDWMDENDRRAARQKLTQFKLSFSDYQDLDISDINFEQLDYWHKLEVTLKYNAVHKWHRLQIGEYRQLRESMEAYEAKVKLIPASNEILAGLGLLQAPFYNYNYPRSMKFSLVGQHVARELIYAFDNLGWNGNPQSTMRWRTDTSQAYYNHSECYRLQYSNYLFNNPDIFRNASNLRELVAESSGLNIAFTAYLSWLESMDPKTKTLSKETLPELNFTNTQLFFIHFAQSRCIAKYKDPQTLSFLPLDLHQPERYNVNGPLINNNEFGLEFGCKLGSEMNPDDKCYIF